TAACARLTCGERRADARSAGARPGAATMTILVERLSLIYHAGSPLERVALRDVSLRVADGSCAAIVGVTGSGKSTLAQCLNGLLTPTRGRVVVDDLEL